MLRFRKRKGAWLVMAMIMAVSVLPIRGTAPTAQAWVVNGQQTDIPFWYTLCEAIKAYMIGDRSPDSCSSIE